MVIPQGAFDPFRDKPKLSKSCDGLVMSDYCVECTYQPTTTHPEVCDPKLRFNFELEFPNPKSSC